MNFRRIQHFIEVAEVGNLSKAAKRLNIVQPALSQSIRRLEEDLNVALFSRSRKGMELTEAGQQFLISAHGIINQYNRAREDISTMARDPQGLVSVAMTASALNVLTVPLCQLLEDTYTNIDLNLDEGLAGNILKGFESGAYDLVVSYMATPSDSIGVEPLIEEDLFLTGPFETGATSRDIQFDQLPKFPLIMPQEQHGIHQMISNIAEERGVALNKTRVAAALNPTIELVAARQGYSLLPMSAIHNRLDRRGLTARRVIRPKLSHTVYMSYPTHRPLTQATLAVMNLIRQSVAQVHSDDKWPGKLLTKPATDASETPI